MLSTSSLADRKINVNGITINYEDSGPGGKESTTLILVHAFPYNKDIWRKQFDFFKNTCRVISYDIRGFGQSLPGNERLTLDLYANDLVQLMDALKIEKAVVCGISMGGYILLNAIDRFPGRFEGVVFADTQCASDSIETFDKRHFAIQQLEAGGINEFALAQLKKAITPENFNQQKNLVENLRRQIISVPVKTLTNTLNALLQRKDMCRSLSRIDVPALVICGKEDTVTPVAQAEHLFKNIPDATIHLIDKAAHLSNIDQPEQFNRYLAAFLMTVIK